VIIGVSDEPAKLLEKYIDQQKVAFPVIQSRDAGRAYSLKGYPTYVLIGPDGKLVADTGHGLPTRATIEAALADVVLVPEPVSARVEPPAASMHKRRYAEAAKELDNLAAAELEQAEADYVARLRQILEQIASKASQQVADLAKGPDYLAAQTRLERIAEDFEGMPPGDEAEAELARFKSDKDIKREITALAALAKMRKAYPLTKSSSAKKLAPQLAALERKYAGTHAADKARALRESLER
jgi:hypothetical protein